MAKKTPKHAKPARDKMDPPELFEALEQKSKVTVKELLAASKAADLANRRDLRALSNSGASARRGIWDYVERHEQITQDQGKLILASLVVSFSALLISIVGVVT